MTPENDDRRPPQEPDTQPEKSKSTLEALNDTAVGQKASQALKTVTGTAAKVQRNPVIAHLLRAAERFNDRLGNQFGAAITYFSFLSMIPILMVSFAAAGFVLAWHPTLLQDIFDKILQNVSDPTLAATLKNTINTAVQQRTAVRTGRPSSWGSFRNSGASSLLAKFQKCARFSKVKGMDSSLDLLQP